MDFRTIAVLIISLMFLNQPQEAASGNNNRREVEYISRGAKEAIVVSHDMTEMIRSVWELVNKPQYIIMIIIKSQTKLPSDHWG